MLQWEFVTGATYYKIYEADVPNPTNWGEPIAIVEDNSYSVIINAEKKFYHVIAESEEDPNFVYVPAGTFTMGRTIGDGGFNELPTHTVSLPSYYISKHEVTQAEWTEIMGSNPAYNWGVGDSYPVYYVSWFAILKFCNLRSIVEGLAPVYSISGSTNPVDWGEIPTSYNNTWNSVICNWDANGYRLPTEAEWEYAARGATNNPDYLYAGSDTIGDVAWYSNNSNNGTKQVGIKNPNGIYLSDMSGNVWEWCWDLYSSSYYQDCYNEGTVSHPKGPIYGGERVLRGGSFNNPSSLCRLAFRNYIEPYYNSNHRGFRLVRSH
jgi:formylglycine-generating enzyme required for sulfatase activity